MLRGLKATTPRTLRGLIQTRFLHGRATKNEFSPLFSTNPEKRELLNRILRVDHAGEFGAVRIYEGQLAVLPHNTVIQEMKEQEEGHLDAMQKLIVERRVRPSLLNPIWSVGAYAMGMGSALLGPEAAMACTEAVEDVITEHYNSQLRELIEKTPEDTELREIVKQFRDDEEHHQATAIDHHSRKAPMYSLLYPSFKAVTQAAVYVAQRV